jgi:predicted dehydrogenase
LGRRYWRGGLIGCGFFAANQMHAWRSIPGVDIVAVCDLDLKKALAVAGSFGVASVYCDANEMLQSENLDFVDIVTTVGSHQSLVEIAAPFCRLVICQKPFSESLDAADAMINACMRNSASLLIHENFRWQRPFLKVAERIGEGAIGKPRKCDLTFRHAYDIYSGQPYLLSTERLALMDVGSHLFDLARALMGEVVSIRCTTQHQNPAVRGEDGFLALLGHADGSTTEVDCSFFDQSGTHSFPQTLALVVGTGGSLEIALDYTLIETRDGVVTEHSVEPVLPDWGRKPWHCIQDSVINIQRHAVEILEGRAQPQPSGGDNRATLAVVLAAYDSAAQNRTVYLFGQGGAA